MWIETSFSPEICWTELHFLCSTKQLRNKNEVNFWWFQILCFQLPLATARSDSCCHTVTFFCVSVCPVVYGPPPTHDWSGCSRSSRGTFLQMEFMVKSSKMLTKMADKDPKWSVYSCAFGQFWGPVQNWPCGLESFQDSVTTYGRSAQKLGLQRLHTAKISALDFVGQTQICDLANLWWPYIG